MSGASLALALALAALDFAGRTVEVPASPNATAEELVALALRKRRDDAHAALAALEAREAEELQGRGEGRMPRDWATALDLLAPVRDDDPERPPLASFVQLVCVTSASGAANTGEPVRGPLRRYIDAGCRGAGESCVRLLPVERLPGMG